MTVSSRCAIEMTVCSLNLASVTFQTVSSFTLSKLRVFNVSDSGCLQIWILLALFLLPLAEKFAENPYANTVCLWRRAAAVHGWVCPLRALPQTALSYSGYYVRIAFRLSMIFALGVDWTDRCFLPYVALQGKQSRVMAMNRRWQEWQWRVHICRYRHHYLFSRRVDFPY